MVMIFFSLTCYKQVLVSLRRCLPEGLQVSNTVIDVGSPRSAWGLGACGRGGYVYIAIGWSGDRIGGQVNT